VLNISIICSDPNHAICKVLKKWVAIQTKYYNLEVVHNSAELREQGDFLFLVSCSEFIEKKVRDRFTHTLILHASNLPYGRGWSPHVWEILNGAPYITLTLLEAEDTIDSGMVWIKEKIQLSGHELLDEINALLFSAEIKLIELALNQYEQIRPKQQSSDIAPTYYPKRNPKDSCIDISKPLNSQFNLLRVCDNDRFPAFFERDGYRYTLKIEKVGKVKSEKYE